MTTPTKIAALLGTWSRPTDLPSKVALGLAVVLALLAIAGRGRSLLLGFDASVWAGTSVAAEAEAHGRSERRRFLAVAAFVAALLSVAYVSSYLLGGPRIIDATTYFLQARALSHGDLAWTPLEPTASFHGRFLIHREEADGPSLGGIFPPGYPLLLSFGFMIGAPMIVGPLLAAALVVATYQLARALAEERAPDLAEPIARGAALLSVLSAALRYHTADTMSHGASALGVTVALTCAIRARRFGAKGDGFEAARLALFAGAAAGYVFATRPVSALPIGLTVAWLLASRDAIPAGSPARARVRGLLFAALGALPGVALLMLSQYAVTGSWLTSTQRFYYALADGPPGCFRWGFGAGTGCLFEHGEFVQARLPNGYGIVEALGTTLRRLWPHLLDVANLEPLALLVLVPALWRGRAIRAATALVGLQVLAYLPFYFDGNYPGGGARFFADVLPVEHALVMLAIGSLASRRATGRPIAVLRGAFAVLSLAAAGFAVHASHEHIKLRDRDGGPMFQPDELTRASISRGLIFVETDHGFNLGHDPVARPSTGIFVARQLKDDRDRLLYEALQRPPTYLYKVEATPGVKRPPSITPWTPPERRDVLRFETEAEWPVLSQTDGFAVPAWVDGCAGNSRALVLTPTSSGPARATFVIPVPKTGRFAVDVRVVHGARVPFAPGGLGAGLGTLRVGDQAWSWTSKPLPPPDDSACESLGPKEIELTAPRATVTLETTGGLVAVDAITLRSVP